MRLVGSGTSYRSAKQRRFSTTLSRRYSPGDYDDVERGIRQIENQSLKKLQSLAEAQKLRDVA